MTADRCTCRPGRDHDGSEFGPCEWCEEQAWRAFNGLTNDDLEAQIATQPDHEPIVWGRLYRPITMPSGNVVPGGPTNPRWRWR